MEQTVLVDTDILIKAYRGDEIKMHNLSLLKGKYAISVITAIELISGSKNIKQLASLERVLKIYPAIHINEIVSRQAYKLYQHTLRQLIGLPDCLIASTSIKQGLLLYTDNKKDYSFIKEINFYIER